MAYGLKPIAINKAYGQPIVLCGLHSNKDCFAVSPMDNYTLHVLGLENRNFYKGLT